MAGRAGKLGACAAAGALALGWFGAGAAAAAVGDAHGIDVGTFDTDGRLNVPYVGAGEQIQIDGTCTGADPATDFLLVGALPAGTDVNDPASQFVPIFDEGGEVLEGALVRPVGEDGSFDFTGTVSDLRGDYDVYAICAFYTDTSWPYVVVPDVTLLGASGAEASPSAVDAGGSVTVTGRGFAAGESVRVVVPGGATTTVTADADGVATAAVSIPASAAGELAITATGADSALAVSAIVSVASSATVPTNTNGLPRAATDVLAGA